MHLRFIAPYIAFAKLSQSSLSGKWTLLFSGRFVVWAFVCKREFQTDLIQAFIVLHGRELDFFESFLYQDKKDSPRGGERVGRNKWCLRIAPNVPNSVPISFNTYGAMHLRFIAPYTVSCEVMPVVAVRQMNALFFREVCCLSVCVQTRVSNRPDISVHCFAWPRTWFFWILFVSRQKGFATRRRAECEITLPQPWYTFPRRSVGMHNKIL